MNGERLNQIREATAKCPRAFNERGNWLIKRAVVVLNGPIAIDQRSELLTYVDELVQTNMKLRDKLLEVAKSCAECDGEGIITEHDDDGGADKQVPCDACADIRELLE